jgi:hypothetical protein
MKQTAQERREKENTGQGGLCEKEKEVEGWAG